MGSEMCIRDRSIAHGYQVTLAQEASRNENNLPLCRLCKSGIFLKSTNNAVVYEAFKDRLSSVSGSIETEGDLEKFIIENCLVEDIGGFLYAPGGEKLSDDAKSSLGKVGLLGERNKPKFGNVKRTSNFYTGYMIPVKEVLENVVIEPQLHSRYALGTPFVERERRGQMIYYVELSSATYTFSFDLDSRFIGKTTFSYEHSGQNVVNDRDKRIVVSLDALNKFLTEMMFGAKKTRFLPVVEWESIAIAVSSDVWTVPSSQSRNYLKALVNKAEKFSLDDLTVHVYFNPELLEDTETYVRKTTEEIIEIMNKVISEWKTKIEEKLPAYKDKIDIDRIVKEKLERLISERMEELVTSSSLRYVNTIKKPYEDFLKMRDERNLKDKVKLYDSFEEAISGAIEDAKSRIKSE